MHRANISKNKASYFGSWILFIVTFANSECRLSAISGDWRQSGYPVTWCYTSIEIFKLNRPIGRDVISNYQRTTSGQTSSQWIVVIWWWVLYWYFWSASGELCGVVLGHGFDSFQTSELFGQCQWVGWCLVAGLLVNDHDGEGWCSVWSWARFLSVFDQCMGREWWC
jgi:hypothetical protein